MRERAFATLIPLLLLSLPLFSEPWSIVEKSGNWEVVEPLRMKTAFDSSKSSVTYQNLSRLFRGWTLSFDLSLETEEGTSTEGVFKIEVPEWRLEIEYRETLRASMAGLGNQVDNTLVIRASGESQRAGASARFPQSSRLDTMIYVWVWRSGEDTVSWVVSDYYQLKPESKRQTIWRGNLTTDNFNVTLIYSLHKIPGDSSAGRVEATLYQSKILDGSDEPLEGVEAQPYGSEEMSLYLSTSLLAFVFLWNVVMRRERREAPPPEKPEVVKKRKRKRK
ncbi:MAG: hypothetical protein ACE5GD_06815 [Candidatus Geothermarchaeales archaeon]